MSENETATRTPAVPSVVLPGIDGGNPGPMMLWNPLTASFFSGERALLLKSSSLLLLQHYLENTATFLVAKPLSSNPFITLVLPLAYSDDLLMHAVLALSGTQLSFKKSGDLSVQSATREHYSLLLRNLGHLFADECAHHDIQRTLRLLLVLVVLCHIEAISGEPNGGIFPHLRASRELVYKLLHEPREDVHPDTRAVEGFALEMYYYLVIVNSITPYGSDEARALPLDAFFTPLDFLKEYQTYGVMLSCGQGLFELIPQVSILARKRLMEEASGLRSSESQATYECLLDSISQWQPPPVISEMTEWQQECAWAGEIYRQALFIFLKASSCGSVVNNPKTIIAIQRHIDTAFPLLVPVSLTPLVTVLLWPLMMIGSCLICESQRREYLKFLDTEPKVEIGQVSQAGKLLQYLWEDGDERAYGSFGLHLIMKKHNINFSMA
ncbi:C6 zinc finger domain-containing protein [Cladophialophora carrionii]|uniref:C6 zinc finger domain-containing protein n=1 Tax=Cladophialophora carrionii TaxID=86049 RepID=A0A1C1CCA1_9EURO|nr:C6 zinc finger domain-containing protein [Cladophialophora carrionii]